MHDCDMFRLPRTRTDFWSKKQEGNRKHDSEVIQALISSGIRVLVIWECYLKGKEKLPQEMLLSLIKTFFLSGGQSAEINEQGLRFTF